MKVIFSIFFREFICSSQHGGATLNQRTLITPLMRVVSLGGVVGLSLFCNARGLAVSEAD